MSMTFRPAGLPISITWSACAIWSDLIWGQARNRSNVALDPHTKSGRESGDTRMLNWCCSVSKPIGRTFVDKCAIEKEVMEVTLKPESQTVTCLWSIIAPRNSWACYIAPAQYASVTRLSPAFCVIVWLRRGPSLASSTKWLKAQQQVSSKG